MVKGRSSEEGCSGVLELSAEGQLQHLVLWVGVLRKLG